MVSNSPADDADDGKADFLRYLVSTGRINRRWSGIAALAADKGETVLTPKQEAVFDELVRRPYYGKCCKVCGCGMRWREMQDALDNGGTCNSCWHLVNKES